MSTFLVLERSTQQAVEQRKVLEGSDKGYGLVENTQEPRSSAVLVSNDTGLGYECLILRNGCQIRQRWEDVVRVSRWYGSIVGSVRLFDSVVLVRKLSVTSSTRFLY